MLGPNLRLLILFAGFCLFCLGILLGVIGAILRLCEWSWGNVVGSMGSVGFLLIAAYLIATALWWYGMLYLI